MRGKHIVLHVLIIAYRITPSDAGKTELRVGCGYNIWDHPRGCGENSRPARVGGRLDGSPPRMRGKPRRCRTRKRPRRITPAGAGKTLSVLLTPSAFQDHPRRCGENVFDGDASYRHLGSPPQVRGKLYTIKPFSANVGITPAGAGKTPKSIPFFFVGPDHPRRCGENKICYYYRSCLAGSPPQVRGKRILNDFDSSYFGITPAGAGKTLTLCRRNRASRDHPRRCGENSDFVPP